MEYDLAACAVVSEWDEEHDDLSCIGLATLDTPDCTIGTVSLALLDGLGAELLDGASGGLLDGAGNLPANGDCCDDPVGDHTAPEDSGTYVEYTTYDFVACEVVERWCEPLEGCSMTGCCGCEAQPVYWSFTWPSLTEVEGFDGVPAEGDYILEMVNCSTNVNPELFALHTRWLSSEGFTYNSGASFQSSFELTCGKPTIAEGGPDRQYRLRVFARNVLFDSAQVIGFHLLVIGDVPTEEECLGPLDLPSGGDPFGFGIPDPLTLTAAL